MSARQLQDLLSSVVKLPVVSANASAVSAVNSSPAASVVVSAARSPVVAAFGCSDRRCHLSRHRHRHNSSSSDLVYFSPVGGGGGGGGGTGGGGGGGGDCVMSSGDKWKGMFGRLRNRTKHKRR